MPKPPPSLEKSKRSPEVVRGDCQTVLASRIDTFDLVFADPPFNVGMEYSGYYDRRDDYAEFTKQWVSAGWRACDGIMAIHIPPTLDGLLHDVTKSLSMKRLRKLIWGYSFGQNTKTTWPDSFCECWIFTKHKKWTWNPDDVLIESQRLLSGDKRTEQSADKGWKVPPTIWGLATDARSEQIVEPLMSEPNWGRIQGNNPERIPMSPCQLPERYMARLTKAYTNKFDNVLEMFGGTGTLAVVAEALERNVTVIDTSAANVKAIKARLKKGALRV